MSKEATAILWPGFNKIMKLTNDWKIVSSSAYRELLCKHVIRLIFVIGAFSAFLSGLILIECDGYGLFYEDCEFLSAYRLCKHVLCWGFFGGLLNLSFPECCLCTIVIQIYSHFNTVCSWYFNWGRLYFFLFLRFQRFNFYWWSREIVRLATFLGCIAFR